MKGGDNMFRKKSKHTKITCNIKTLSDILKNNQIASISVSEEIDISEGLRRKEYTLVEIGMIDDRIIAGFLEDDIFEIQQSLLRAIKSCDNMLILTMKYTNNHIKEINMIGMVYKVDVRVEELRLKIRLFINK